MLHIAHHALRHMARDAILTALAFTYHMTRDTARRNIDFRAMRIVTSATPQFLAARLPAAALGDFFKMTVDLHFTAARTDKGSLMIGKAFPWLKWMFVPAMHDTDLAGKMALCANALAPVRLELCGVHDVARTAHVGLARTMATLAADSVLQKRRHCKAILRTGQRLQSARMAL